MDSGSGRSEARIGTAGLGTFQEIAGGVRQLCCVGPGLRPVPERPCQFLRSGSPTVSLLSPSEEEYSRTMQFSYWLRLILVCFVFSFIAVAQQAKPAASGPIDDDFIQKQFGSTCKLM